MNNENELQNAWVKLQTEKASLYEAQALACVHRTEVEGANLRIAQIDLALSRLKEARALRLLLTKIDCIADITLGR